MEEEGSSMEFAPLLGANRNKKKHPTRKKVLKVLLLSCAAAQSVGATIYIFPAASLTSIRLGYKDEAIPVGSGSFVGKFALVFFFLVTPYSKMAKVINKKLLEPDWWRSLKRMPVSERQAAAKEAFKSILMYLPGIAPALFFSFFINVTCVAFVNTVEADKNDLNPIFLTLAGWASSVGLRVFMEMCSASVNLIGAPAILSMTHETIQKLFTDAKKYAAEDKRARFGGEVLTGFVFAGVCIWGMTNYIPLTFKIAKEYLGLSFYEALPLVIAQMGIMCTLGSVLSMILGRGVAEKTMDIATCRFEEWPEKREVAKNTAIGVAAFLIALLAGAGVVFQGIEAEQLALTLVATWLSSICLDAIPLYVVAEKVVEKVASGCKYLWQTCSSALFSPKAKLNPALPSVQVIDDKASLLPPPSPTSSKRFCCTVQ